MKTIKIILALLYVVQLNILVGQGFYMVGKIKPLLNPAFVGTFNQHEVNIIGRDKVYKTTGINKYTNSYFVDYETYIPKLKSGIAVYLFNSEKLNEISYKLDEKQDIQNIGVSYNYQSNLGKKWAFSVGAGVKYSNINNYIDIADCNLQYYNCNSNITPHNPFFKRNDYSKTNTFNLGGVLYTKRFNVSFSANDLFHFKESKDYYGNMGFNIFFKNKDHHKLSFNLGVKNLDTKTWVSNYIQYAYKFVSVGASINHDIPGTYSLKASVNTKLFNLSYCYTHKIKEWLTFFGTPYRFSLTHEIALTLKIPSINKRQSKPLHLLLF